MTVGRVQRKRRTSSGQQKCKSLTYDFGLQCTLSSLFLFILKIHFLAPLYLFVSRMLPFFDILLWYQMCQQSMRHEMRFKRNSPNWSLHACPFTPFVDKKSIKCQEIFMAYLLDEGMVFRKKYDESLRKHIRVLRNELHCSMKKASQVTGVSTATVKRICKKDDRQPTKNPAKKTKRGRPRTLQDRDVRKLIQRIKKFRQDDNGGNFTIKDTRNAAGLIHVPLHTVRLALHRQGFGFRIARRKGMLTAKDLRVRVKFAKKMTR